MTDVFNSKHFELLKLDSGVYAAIHKWGGAAYSNAGIIDLGDRTVIIDAFDMATPAVDLRNAAEKLTERPASILLLSHAHGDHWGGAQVFGSETCLISGHATREGMLKWIEWFQQEGFKVEDLEIDIQEKAKRLETESDPRVRLGLERSITRDKYIIEDLPFLAVLLPEQTIEGRMTYHGSEKSAEVVVYGPAHSQEDLVVLMEEEKIAFLGDIAFFQQQPYMGDCDLAFWKDCLKEYLESEFEVIVPGHGPVGGKKDIDLQLQYFDALEAAVAKVVENGGGVEEALQAGLPAPFDEWLMGGMTRFEINIRYLLDKMGAEVQEI